MGSLGKQAKISGQAVKLVVTDLDDTLLRSDKSLSDFSLRTLERVRARGVKVIYATARGTSADYLLSPDHFDGRVLLNGARAYLGDRLVYERTLDPDTYRPLLLQLSDQGIRVTAEAEGIHHANFHVGHVWPYLSQYRLTQDWQDIGPADKLYALLDDPAQADGLREALPDQAYLHLARDGLAMVMHNEAKKSQGMLAIAHHLGIEKEAIVAFGDDVNDLDMLEAAGYSLAMANAIPQVRAKAQAICDSNDRDGVARWLARHILSEQD